MALLVLLNNFMHDFSAAGWLVGSVLLWSILRRTFDAQEARSAVSGIVQLIVTTMRISFVGIVVFGGVRMAAYTTYEWNEAAGDSQITLLIVKHVLLAGVFFWGLIHYLRARKAYGIARP